MCKSSHNLLNQKCDVFWAELGRVSYECEVCCANERNEIVRLKSIIIIIIIIRSVCFAYADDDGDIGGSDIGAATAVKHLAIAARWFKSLFFLRCLAFIRNVKLL